MKCSSARDWRVGDRGKTAEGQIVTIEAVVYPYLRIKEKDLEKRIYLPAHGEIEKV